MLLWEIVRVLLTAAVDMTGGEVSGNYEYTRGQVELIIQAAEVGGPDPGDDVARSIITAVIHGQISVNDGVTALRLLND